MLQWFAVLQWFAQHAQLRTDDVHDPRELVPLLKQREGGQPAGMRVVLAAREVGRHSGPDAEGGVDAKREEEARKRQRPISTHGGIQPAVPTDQYSLSGYRTAEAAVLFRFDLAAACAERHSTSVCASYTSLIRL